ncbi:hypothetical protein BU17DRAFT_79273 [Hysterangium stoloniferum]|nr:hypothetical protein BU17DRAFT_79273 [Hysterangium stoloniferum]
MPSPCSTFQPFLSMYRSSGDYYTSSSTTHRSGRSTNLPPIHDVVGDVLQQPVRPVSSGYDSHRPMERSYTMSPQPQYSHTRQSGSGPHLPPMHSQRYPDSSSQRYPQASGQYHASSSQPPMRQQYPPPRSNTPGHSYDVFVSTSNAGLVHKRSSARDDFTQVPREDAIATSTARSKTILLLTVEKNLMCARTVAKLSAFHLICGDISSPTGTQGPVIESSDITYHPTMAKSILLL